MRGLLESRLRAPDNPGTVRDHQPVGGPHQHHLAVGPVQVVAGGSSLDVESVD